MSDVDPLEDVDDDVEEGNRRSAPTAAPPDDLAVVVRADGELEHERPVVLGELLDLDAVGLVDQRPRQLLQEFAGRGGHGCG